jgi:hypothetical protein
LNNCRGLNLMVAPAWPVAVECSLNPSVARAPGTGSVIVICSFIKPLPAVYVCAGGEVDYAEHIAPLRAAAPPSMRCVLVSATLPQHTFDELQELFMGLGTAFGPGLHRTAQGEDSS